MVACGVPCTEFSTALTTRPRNLNLGDRLALKALEIIQYLQPPRWWIENPRNGHLPNRPYMEGIPYADVDYCQYSDWGYKKPTRIWADSITLTNLKPRICDGLHCLNLDLNAPPK